MIGTLKGDITGLDFDLIVNPCNMQMTPTQGISGLIFEKGGENLLEACKELKGCPVGKAKMTDGYNLRCKGIIHTCGPVYIDGQRNEDEYLASCYWNSMSLAYKFMRDHELDSVNIAFPCISTKSGLFPNDLACKIAVQTIKRLMNKFPETKKIHVCFVCDNDVDYALYKEELKLR